MTSVALFTRPGLASLVERVRATLSPDGQRRVDEHVTQADMVATEAFEGLTPWRLTGSDVLWFKLPEYAEASGMTRQAAVKHVDEMIKRGEIATEDVRRSVRDSALDPNDNPGLSLENNGSPVRLTTSPTGVTLLSPRALLLLSQRSDSDRGKRIRAAMLRLMERSAETERLLLGMMVAETERLVAQRASDMDQARALVSASEATRIVRTYVDEMAAAATVPERNRLAVAINRDVAAHEAIAIAIEEGDEHTIREYRAIPSAMPARYAAALRDPVNSALTRIRCAREEAERKRKAHQIALVRSEATRRLTEATKGLDEVLEVRLAAVIEGTGLYYMPFPYGTNWDFNDIMVRLGFTQDRMAVLIPGSDTDHTIVWRRREDNAFH